MQIKKNLALFDCCILYSKHAQLMM